MSCAEGEAFMAPNESKGGRPERDRKGQVTIGEGAVTSIADVPRGESERIEALIAAEAGAGGTLEETARSWSTSLSLANALLAANRDRVEAAFIEHVQRPAPRLAAFQDQRRLREKNLAAEIGLYTTATVAGQSLGVSTLSTLELVALADRDLQDLCTALGASGHATRGPDGVLVIDAARVAAESDALRSKARDAGLPGARPDTSAHADLEEAQVGLKEATGRLAASSLELRAREASDSAADKAAEIERLETRIALASELDGLITSVTSVFHEVDGYFTWHETEDAPFPGAPTFGLVGQLLASDDIEQLRRVRALVHGYEVIAKTRADVALGVRMANDLDHFEESLVAYLRRLERVQQANAGRREDLGLLGVRLDHEGRQAGDMDEDHERYAPIAHRLARVQAASASNQLAQGAIAGFVRQADKAAEPVDSLILQGSIERDLYDLRRSLGITNVPKTLGRKITRFGDGLAANERVLADASKEAR